MNALRVHQACILSAHSMGCMVLLETKLIELSSINKVSIICMSSCGNSEEIKDLQGGQFRTDRTG